MQYPCRTARDAFEPMQTAASTPDRPRPAAAGSGPGRPLWRLAWAGLGVPALLAPSAAGPFDLAALLAWLAWCAPAVGLLAGRRPGRGATFLTCAVGWALCVVLAVHLGPQRQVLASLPRALAGLGFPLGALAAGLGFGRWLPRRGPLLAYLVLASGLLASGASVLGGLGGAPLARRAPTAAARALDLAPTTLTLEAAGVDWMRHPSIYEPAGTDWFSDRRRPYSGASGGVSLVLGLALGLALGALHRRRTGATRTDALP